jgi:thymidylate synthase
MIVIEGSTATDLFRGAADTVLRTGVESAPRGLLTREILGAHLRLTQPRSRLVHIPDGRVLNTAFAVAEAMWIISGSDATWIYDYNRNLHKYTDNGLLRGAYGPRMRRWHGTIDQLDHARQLLIADSESRRAVVQLFDPERDHEGHRDVPCTLGYRFFVRDHRLHMHTTMRSQDLWLGFPYDIFTATLLHELMAGWLGVELGTYQHSVDSLHLYADDWERAASLPDIERPAAMDPISVAWTDLDPTLTAVITGRVKPDAGPVWPAFASVMASYQLWRNGHRDDALALANTVPGILGDALTSWYGTLAVRA